MKKVPCSYPDCGNRRVHWCNPDTPRGTQMVEVADDYEYAYGKREAYCSMTCALMNGWMTLKFCRPDSDPCKARGCKLCNEDKQQER